LGTKDKCSCADDWDRKTSIRDLWMRKLECVFAVVIKQKKKNAKLSAPK